jgi:hypothetical protein
MTATGFRRIALGMPGAIEGSHMGSADFRVNGRIFASLPDQNTGVVKLTPAQQQLLREQHADAVEPAAGAWGRQGWTRIKLAAADSEMVGEAATLAWQNVSAAAPPRKRKARKRS